jgi:hypothetical protein
MAECILVLIDKVDAVFFFSKENTCSSRCHIFSVTFYALAIAMNIRLFFVICVPDRNIAKGDQDKYKW